MKTTRHCRIPVCILAAVRAVIVMTDCRLFGLPESFGKTATLPPSTTLPSRFLSREGGFSSRTPSPPPRSPIFFATSRVVDSSTVSLLRPPLRDVHLHAAASIPFLASCQHCQHRFAAASSCYLVRVLAQLRSLRVRLSSFFHSLLPSPFRAFIRLLLSRSPPTRVPPRCTAARRFFDRELEELSRRKSGHVVASEARAGRGGGDGGGGGGLGRALGGNNSRRVVTTR